MEPALGLTSTAATASDLAADVERARRELAAAVEFVALTGASLVLANLPGVEAALAEIRVDAGRRGIELEPERRENGVDVRVRRR